MNKSFYHTGEYGDLVAALPVVRALGGGDMVLGMQQPPFNCHNQNVTGITQERFNVIAPLLRVQSYITNVEFGFRPVDYDISDFRKCDCGYNATTTAWQATYLNIPNVDTSPWLTVPTVKSHDKILVSKNCKYNNPQFPWSHIVDRYKNQILFLGLAQEHEELEHLTHSKIEFSLTSNLLEAAQLIAGASLGFYSASVLAWIAVGLGCPTIVSQRYDIHTAIVVHDNVNNVNTAGKAHQLRAALISGDKII